MTQRTTSHRDDGPGGSDGINAQDPGVHLLAGALARIPTPKILAVCSGPIPLVSGATRLVLDLRDERAGFGPTVRWTADAETLAGFSDAAIWPRAHLGKDFSQQCIVRGAMAVAIGGRVWCSVRKQKGAASFERFMMTLLGNVEVVGRARGYRLLCAERRGALDAACVSTVLALRYPLSDPRLEGMTWCSAPGTFSRRALDAGTAALIDVAVRTIATRAHPKIVLDLCCGVGVLGLWAAIRLEHVAAVGVDTNLLAIACARENAKATGLAGRVQFYEGDGLSAPAPGLAASRGRIDLALVNPPTHADPTTLRQLFAPLGTFLRPQGHVLVVAARPQMLIEILRERFSNLEVHSADGYTVIEASTVRAP